MDRYGAKRQTDVKITRRSRFHQFVTLVECKRCRQRLRHALVHRIAHPLAGEHVLDAGQVMPALVGGHIGDVGHPGFVRPGRRESLIEQVVGHRQVMIRVRGGLELALLFAVQSSV